MKAANANCTMAPSYGHTHKSGKPYKRIIGGPDSMAEITMAEREQIFDLFRQFDKRPPKPKREIKTSGSRERKPGDPKLPGDDFNERGDWVELLQDDGWEHVRSSGAEDHWRRPDASTDGIDAVLYTWEDDEDDEKVVQRLYVPSGGARGQFNLPDDQDTFDLFSYYTFAHHEGDFKAAAKAIGEAGYGEKSKKKSKSKTPPKVKHQQVATGTDGVVVDLAERRAEKVEEAVAEMASTLDQTDDSNANLFAAQHGHVIRYSRGRGCWMHWNGVRWVEQPDTGGVVRELAKETARSLPEAVYEDGEMDVEQTKRNLSWKSKSLSRAGISAKLGMAESLPALAVDEVSFDAHPWEVNTPGGILNLRSCEIRPHNQQRLYTKLTAVTPDFDADRSIWSSSSALLFPTEPLADT